MGISDFFDRFASIIRNLSARCGDGFLRKRPKVLLRWGQRDAEDKEGERPYTLISRKKCGKKAAPAFLFFNLFLV